MLFLHNSRQPTHAHLQTARDPDAPFHVSALTDGSLKNKVSRIASRMSALLETGAAEYKVHSPRDS